MRVIGVLDLMAGRAVHARGGRRDQYAPVARAAGETIDGDAVALARTYVQRLGLEELYAADLDAIAGAGASSHIVPALASLAPLWLDAGVSSAAAAQRAVEAGAAYVIVGLETLSSFSALADICTAVGRERVAFSLDLRDGAPVNSAVGDAPPERLAARAVEAGAGTVIVLDLGRVGGGRGLDEPLISRVRAAVPAVTLIAGGGIGGAADLERLAGTGCDGALVATALHNGRVTASHVAAAQQRQTSVSR